MKTSLGSQAIFNPNTHFFLSINFKDYYNVGSELILTKFLFINQVSSCVKGHTSGNRWSDSRAGMRKLKFALYDLHPGFQCLQIKI